MTDRSAESHDDPRPAAERFACQAARLLADNKCEDVLVLDLRGLSHVADYFVLGTGTSDRQASSVAADLRELSRREHESILGSEGGGSARWLVVDFVDVVVHLFDADTRAYYDLESLWADAGPVDWEAVTEPGRSPGHPSSPRTERDGGD